MIEPRDSHEGHTGTLRTQVLIAVATALVMACPCSAQERPDSAGSTGEAGNVGQDTDPTKPVAFSLRGEFARLGDDASLNFFIFRLDRLTLEGLAPPGPVRGVLTRINLPVITFSNPSTTQTGLGDIYLQALVAPRIQRSFFVAGGTGLVLPTQTSPLLGFGKRIVSPAIVPICFFPKRGLAYIKFQGWYSFAGQANRQDVHYLTVTPSILLSFSTRWWVFLDTESNINWLKERHTWFRSGALLGYMISNRLGVSVKGEIPFGQYRPFDWIVKTSFCCHSLLMSHTHSLNLVLHPPHAAST